MSYFIKKRVLWVMTCEEGSASCHLPATLTSHSSSIYLHHANPDHFSPTWHFFFYLSIYLFILIYLFYYVWLFNLLLHLCHAIQLVTVPHVHQRFLFFFSFSFLIKEKNLFVSYLFFLVLIIKIKCWTRRWENVDKS